ncbi:hypothetical protein ACFSKW_54660 [Nonomuraea mangrovi]|uniref:DUF7426 domain-containing protein n=1 Tax=Nonomuraea mangrovi TaxID=2316207 RepID=A0ABW4TFK9_9ACTN
MPKFPEVAAFLGETLDLPINGTVYSVPPVDAETGVRLVSRFTEVASKADDEEVSDDLTEIALYQETLGPVYAQLLAAKVPWPMIKAAGLTALTWHLHGEDTALIVWERGGFPKRALTSTTAEPPVIQGEVLSTPSPDSESGTTPNPRKARTSRGRTSSPAGA